jgi:putative acetyltransferase
MPFRAAATVPAPPEATRVMQIRSERPEDREAVFTVNRLAFGQENEARLVDALRKSSAFIPQLSFVALDDFHIVGHILFTRITIQGEDQADAALALAPMAVLPAFQKQGIGSALVRRGLEEARSLGHRVVIVVGHPDYYPRFGFVPARPLGILPPFEVPGEAFMVLELQPGTVLEIQGMVKYPPEFNEV